MGFGQLVNTGVGRGENNKQKERFGGLMCGSADETAWCNFSIFLLSVVGRWLSVKCALDSSVFIYIMANTA